MKYVIGFRAEKKAGVINVGHMTGVWTQDGYVVAEFDQKPDDESAKLTVANYLQMHISELDITITHISEYIPEKDYSFLKKPTQ